MRFARLDQLRRSNRLLREDYTHDYRGSEIPAEIHLDRLLPQDLVQAFGRIRAQLAIPEATLADIYTSVVDGKHILLYGPPGTGKTTLAGLIAQELFHCDVRFETAVADWTPFETVGGLQLLAREGQEYLEPVPGVIVDAIVACLNQVAANRFDRSKSQGVWLALDELNRANMDAAFGQLFTALDQQHPEVSLPFFDPPRKRITVPKRFRILGTMNTYDKNFLFRISYALTRRFALIPVDVPANDDTIGRQEEQEQLWLNLERALAERNIRTATVADLRTSYDAGVMSPLYDELVTTIRAARTEGQLQGLGRGLGFAQIAAALRHAVFAIELGLVQPAAHASALDRGVRSSIVPQLEGLPNSSLQEFVRWWENHPQLKDLTSSIAATKELMRGANLFMTA